MFAQFHAVELRKWSNPDGGVHVAEMAIDRAMFHIHEEVGLSSPLQYYDYGYRQGVVTGSLWASMAGAKEI